MDFASVVNSGVMTVACLLHWAFTFIYSMMGMMQCIARIYLR